MKRSVKPILLVAVVVLIVGAWIVHFHTAWVKSISPGAAWIQNSLSALGEAAPPADAGDEDPNTMADEIPVKTAQITKATFHRYIDGFGTIAPRLAGSKQMAGSAAIAAPAPGVVAEVLCEVGQQVKKGDPLIQLDDRVAKAAEIQAQAALAQESANMANLKATPRPEQLQIANLAVEKATIAVDFSQKNYARQEQLAAEQGTSSKSVEQAAMDLKSAQTDLAVAQQQLAQLKASPTVQDMDAETAKMAQAQAALDAAQTLRQVMRIVAPIDATVVAINVNPGEAVDSTHTLVQLIAMDRLMVDVDIPADQLPLLSPGLPVLVTLPGTEISADAGGDNGDIKGKISFISEQVESKTGTVQVGIDLEPGPLVKPGRAASVRIVAEERKDRLAVPRQAVVTDENNDSVIALVEELDSKDDAARGFKKATHKTVKIGLEESGLIEIDADGLKEGDTVVTAGAYGLPAAARVKVTN
jgi:membrane fusion protein (multidrug efflux system)